MIFPHAILQATMTKDLRTMLKSYALCSISYTLHHVPKRTCSFATARHKYICKFAIARRLRWCTKSIRTILHYSLSPASKIYCDKTLYRSITKPMPFVKNAPLLLEYPKAMLQGKKTLVLEYHVRKKIPVGWRTIN